MIVVRKILGLATVQDAGRIGLASQGVPRSGFLVPTLAHAANAAAGNDPDAACVEIFGRFACVAETNVVVIGDERGKRRELRAGEELVVDPDPHLRVRYLAIAGGVDAPIFLGSRSTLAACDLGREIRRGDRLESARAPIHDRKAPPPIESGPIRIVLGPDPGGEPLLSDAFRISTTSDRTGTRLDPQRPVATSSSSSGSLPSSPTVIGAIQLPQGGAPIVIGVDGPVTGGYPIIGAIARHDLDAFHALPLGAAVTFVVVREGPR
jgi:allophanate hydrolase subunit 2